MTANSEKPEPSSTDADVLRTKLEALQTQISREVSHARLLQRLMLAGMAALVVAAALYLRHVYSRVVDLADSQTLVELASAQIEPRLRAEADKLGNELKNAAPTMVWHMETLMLNTPVQLAHQGENRISDQLNQLMPRFEDDLYNAMSGTITETRAKTKAAGVDPNDEKQLNRLVGEIAPVLHDHARRQFDRVRADYTQQADGPIAYIDKLADGVNLTPRQRLHRELLITTLALIKKIELDPSRTPLQELLEDKTTE